MIYWLLISFLCGIFLFLLFLFLIYWFYIKELPRNDTSFSFKSQFEDYFITPALQELILNDNYGSIAALNVLLQFLFQELKDSGSVRRYIIRKMTIEFKELLTTKQIGKIIEKITARDFSLGTGCPIIQSLKLENYKIDKAKLIIQEFTLLMDLEYKDGFSISVDVNLILGRSAYVHIKVASLKGRARVEFKREPFTHWSFAFVSDPEIEFSATSQFESKQIPQLTSLIINQLRRSVRKKHTLPNYKIRFKPFFDQLIQTSAAANLAKSSSKQKTPPPDNCNYSSGKLALTLQNCDHLSDSLLVHYQDAQFYLTVSLDAFSFHTLMSQQTHKNDWPTYDVELTRQNLNEQLGITFVEIMFLNQNEVAVNKILPNSLASNANVVIKVFDILVALNGIKITSLKQAHKLILKANSLVKLQFQRPIVKFKSENGRNSGNRAGKLHPSSSIGSNLNTSIAEGNESDDATKIVSKAGANGDGRESAIDATPISLNRVSSSAALLSSSPSKSTLLSQQLSTTSLNTPVQSSSTIQLVQSTKSRLEQRLNSFRKSTPPVAIVNNSAPPQTPTINIESSPTSSPAAATIIAAATNNITHLASVSALVDFYCAIAEYGPEGNTNDLDLMYLITNDSTSNEDLEKRQLYYKKTKKMKIDNNNTNFLHINETFTFDLNENTKYMNVCLWAAVVNKTKPKNILVGYINIPVNDINSECWSTMKGESKRTCYFKSIESKASAQARPHVLSTHPGFDSSLAFGAVTLSFQHTMNLEKSDGTAPAAAQETKTNIIKETVHKIVDNLFQDVEKETQAAAANDLLDKYTHKFTNFQSNESIFCSFCNKKIWFKNALRCAFCNYLIHIKCYEKAVSSNICPRYSNEEQRNNSNSASTTPTDAPTSSNLLPSSPATNRKSTSLIEQPFIINEEEYYDIETTIDKKKEGTPPPPSSVATTKSLTTIESVASLAQKSSENIANEASRTKTYVTNLLSGLRQRKWMRGSSGRGRGAPITVDIDEAVIIPSYNERDIDTSTSSISAVIRESVNNENSNNSNNSESIDVFQDAEVDFLCGDKDMGKEMFDDLPLNERRIKLEEKSIKYQTTLEMMKNLKEDLEKDLKAKESNNSESTKRLKGQIKAQIEHLEEQMRSVVFLLMRCQEGLDYCQELSTTTTTNDDDNNKMD